MFDSFNREINYLRISVTDRCNLKCTYCVPKSGLRLFRDKDTISFEEIVEVVKVCTQMGIKKFRLTGGEPLVRKGIIKLVEMISSINGVEDLSMTTNGVLLEKMAESLARAGLNRINISLDTVDREKYREITGKDLLDRVLRGIDAAENAGLFPIKINCVLLKDGDSNLSFQVKEFAASRCFPVRFIQQMNLKTGEFSQVIGGNGGICQRCNRIRLTSNGFIKPCLFSDFSFDIRKMGVEKAILQAIGHKPVAGTFNKNEEFYSIGG